MTLVLGIVLFAGLSALELPAVLGAIAGVVTAATGVLVAIRGLRDNSRDQRTSRAIKEVMDVALETVQRVDAERDAAIHRAETAEAQLTEVRAQLAQLQGKTQ